jgi:hypothetical protein
MMATPKLQLEPVTAIDVHVFAGEILEIRNITLKAALQIVRDQFNIEQTPQEDRLRRPD